MNENYLDQIKKMFNVNQFKHKGIIGEEGQERFYQSESKTLFFLENTINSILLPYIIKIEMKLRNMTKGKLDNVDLKRIRNAIVAKSQDYLSDDVWSNGHYKKPSDFGDLSNFPRLLELFRIARNCIMHGSQIIGKRYDLDKINNSLTDMIKQYFTKSKYGELFNKKVFKTPFVFDDNNPTYYSIIFIMLTMFNHERTVRYIFAKIDYEIFKYRTSTNITTVKKLWEELFGLKSKWVTKI